MAFFPPNHGESKMYYPSHNETTDDESLTWYDARQDLSDIHEDERIKDKKDTPNISREKKFLKIE